MFSTYKDVLLSSIMKTPEPPSSFQSIDDIRNYYKNIVFEYCDNHCDGDIHDEYGPENIISDLYIIDKNFNTYTLYIYHSENWFDGDNKDFKFRSATQITNSLVKYGGSLKEATKYILLRKLDIKKQSELYEMLRQKI